MEEKINEKLLLCRCSDCQTGRGHGCNSSRLKELLTAVFDEDTGVAELPGLFCKTAKCPGKLSDEDEECLCAECDLAGGDGRFFCRAAEG